MTYRHFTVEETDGTVVRMTPVQEAATVPRWAHDVSQDTFDWSAQKTGEEPQFLTPIPFVIEPTDDGEPFYQHNHQPSITWLPNGDLLAIWYSTQGEQGTELTVLASRLRAGNHSWDASSEFFKAPNRNMHGSSILHDGQGTVYHFNGMAPDGGKGWAKLALLMRTSRDNGVTWTPPFAVDPRVIGRHQVISGTLLTKNGVLIQNCDAVPGGHGGTALHISHDGGNTWEDPGFGKPAPKFVAGGTGEGTIAGIHAKVIELSDGRLMALGRGDSIDGHMPMSISSDLGRTWRYSASPFPPIGGGQRLVLKKLNEGPLLFVGFTSGQRSKPEANGMTFVDQNGKEFIGHGMYAAVSFDEGKTWPVRKLLTPGQGEFDGGAWTRGFTATPTRAEHAGYLAATQTPDNVIHLISSRLHYRLNLAWLTEGAAAAKVSRATDDRFDPVSGDSQPPNIVVIMADDLGYGDLGCYGSTLHETPHIDALAAGGLRFTDFHSAGPMCSPTRAALLTGQYQQRFGRIFDTAISGTEHRDLGLPHDAVTIAEQLKSRGYATACFGKWHLGYVPPWLPPDQGFDLFRGLGSGDGDFHTHVDRSGNRDWWHNNKLEPDEGYTTDLLTRYSVDFIEQHREQPFFLYVPHLGIHFPWQGPNDPPHRQPGTSYHEDKWGIIPNPGDVSPHVKAMVESLDDSVGQIIDALKKWDLEENTLVIFTSDNGGYLTYGDNFRNISSNGVLRGQKTDLYEGGHRVPAIVSWPGRIAPGVTDEIAHSTDFMPTFAALAGIESKDVETDGVDLGPLLFQHKPLPQRMLFWRARTERAVRDGAWKLFFTDDTAELYNLDDDIGEQHNIAEQQPDRVAAMKSAWTAWEDDVNRSAAVAGVGQP